MYVSIGNSYSVRSHSIVGIFDLDRTTQSAKTRDFLENAEKDGLIVSATDEIPISFIVCREYGMDKIYLSSFSSAILEARLGTH